MGIILGVSGVSTENAIGFKLRLHGDSIMGIRGLDRERNRFRVKASWG